MVVFTKGTKTIQTCMSLCEKAIAPKPDVALRQQLQSSIWENMHSAVLKSWSTLLLQNCFRSATLEHVCAWTTIFWDHVRLMSLDFDWATPKCFCFFKTSGGRLARCFLDHLNPSELSFRSQTDRQTFSIWVEKRIHHQDVFVISETGLHILFDQQWFLPRSSVREAIFAQSVLVESRGPTSAEPSKASSRSDVLLGSFVTSWMSRHCAHGLKFIGQALLGRFTPI